MVMGRFQDLDVYKVAFALMVDVYRATARLPREERYGLVVQMRGAAVSIVSCIAEGTGRATPGEFCNLLSSASGSAAELECQIAVSLALGFMNPGTAADLSERVVRVR